MLYDILIIMVFSLALNFRIFIEKRKDQLEARRQKPQPRDLCPEFWKYHCNLIKEIQRQNKALQRLGKRYKFQQKKYSNIKL